LLQEANERIGRLVDPNTLAGGVEHVDKFVSDSDATGICQRSSDDRLCIRLGWLDSFEGGRKALSLSTAEFLGNRACTFGSAALQPRRARKDIVDC